MGHDEQAVGKLNVQVLNIGAIPGTDISRISTAANGTETITISNVGNSGIGTATIAAWMKITISGTIYYIPMWQ